MMKKYIAFLITAALLCTGAAAFDQTRDSGLMVLVNKNHSIPADLVPETAGLSGRVPVTNSGVALRPEAADAYIRMYQAMAADGVSGCYAHSGYRSYQTQQGLVDRRVRERMNQGMGRQAAYDKTTMSTAPAGTSEHQTGLAIDCSAGSGLGQSFANTAPGKWLKEHAWEYGFVLRYQGEKIDLTMIVSEPWHYRYLGVPHAQIMYENDWCHEEYVDYLHANGSYELTVGDMVYDVYWTDDASREYQGILDISRDNAGGWVITTARPVDPLRQVRGQWSEPVFAALLEEGVLFSQVVDPAAPMTRGQLAGLCGLDAPENPDDGLTREETAQMLSEFLPERALSYLVYQDTAQISGAAFQGVQLAVSNGIFDHGADRRFRPSDALTWCEGAAAAVRFRECGQ